MHQTSKSSDSIVIISNKNLEEKLKENKDESVEKPANFESAIEATGLGKFNILLLIIAIPSIMATALETSTMSYVLPIAQCDLDLSMERKGLLNAITYIGMIPSAFIWGYLADTIGRKKPLAIAYVLNGLSVLLCGFSQQYGLLLAAKFLTGSMINGSFATFTIYLNEFHASKQRAFIPLAHGIVSGATGIILPLVGWATFTDKINISLFDDFIVLRSWNIFFILCSIPSLLAGITYFVLPESPKYLMSMGENEAAMKIFRKVYSLNTGRAPETFPIKTLENENENDNNVHLTANRTTFQALKEGWHQIVPLFHKPYLSKAVLVFTIQFGIMTSINTLRLWLPQIFAAINDYEVIKGEDENPDLCKMLESITPNKNETIKECFVNYDNNPIYINSIIVATAYMFGCLGAACFIGKLGKKTILVLAELTSGVCALCLYYATNEETVVALSSIFISTSGIGAMVIISILVDIFPTTLRTMTLASAMMYGRLGAMSGNLIFPFLLELGCFPPFLTIGSIAISSALLSLLLPKTDNKALK